MPTRKGIGENLVAWAILVVGGYVIHHVTGLATSWTLALIIGGILLASGCLLLWRSGKPKTSVERWNDQLRREGKAALKRKRKNAAQTDRELSEWVLLGERARAAATRLSDSDIHALERADAAVKAELWAGSVRHWLDQSELSAFIGLFPSGESVEFPDTVEQIVAFIDARTSALRAILERRQGR